MYTVLLLGLLLGACAGTEKIEMTTAEKARLEAPFGVELRLLATVVKLELSQNYHKELSLPAGGGVYSTVERQPKEHSWVYRARHDAMTFKPLQVGFRQFKGLVTSSLTISCPPLRKFTIRLQATGAVTLVTPRRKLKGMELIIEDGKVLLDGKVVDFRALPVVKGGV